MAQIPDDGWQRIDVGAGNKGRRTYDWACARLPYGTADGWAQWLLIRRSVAKPEDLAFFRAFGRAEATIVDLVRVAGTRQIDKGFQRAKEIGLDQYEVRRWTGWRRHITLCLLAHAFLEVTRAAAATTNADSPRQREKCRCITKSQGAAMISVIALHRCYRAPSGSRSNVRRSPLTQSMKSSPPACWRQRRSLSSW